MKIKALVTALVLGSSSLALAAPASRPRVPPTVRDHRVQPVPVAAPLPQARFGGWYKPVARQVLLADNARVQGSSLISVAQGTRAFTRLQLTANKGRTNINQVVILFANGHRQVVDLAGKQNGIINAKKSLSIDLQGNGRFIRSITLTGKSGKRASIDVRAI